ncbi:PREDICTED: N-acetylserotonin O-methyltransferase-like protein [Elephantulus edwardii]|uniref:N-acetylserotonin O-methyltransferase-like protein n=1 Tax=Elephantulus edwardii TaxID=28737 RepID=UPI0003F0A8B7|nr:PREDICTED: N-acetylserotonin O-methyltransferase-like protein [Elephantulus edwardii]
MVLSPVIGKLLHKRVVLASASPRRQEILNQAGLRFEVVPSHFKETLEKGSFPTPSAYAVETAKQKALEVAHRMHAKDLRTPDVVIGADTIVTVGGLILEKPVDKQDAYRMLSRLSGKEHSVFTGVAVVHCSSSGQLETQMLDFHEETRVTFSELSEEMLWEYIHSGEPMDKAGGYGIQALGGMLVERVSGDFLNVVGFPLNRFCKELARLYRPPPPEAVHRVKHDSIPTVDTFEDLSDDGESGAGPPRGTPCNGPAQTSPSCPVQLLTLIEGFKASKVLFTACRLKVFDLLKDGVVLPAVDIARHVDTSEEGTEWLLDKCTELRLLDRTEQGYTNSEAATLFLTSQSPSCLHSLIALCSDHVWDRFTRLEAAVREGSDQLCRVSASYADLLFQDPFCRSKEEQLQCLRALNDFTQPSAHAVATAFDLSSFTSACHLGGSTGALALGLAREYPRMQVAVMDLPEVIEFAPSLLPAGPHTARVSFVPGDFLQEEPPKADLYVLWGIPQDIRGQGAAQRLLNRVSQLCRPGCALLVAGAVLDEERTEPGIQVHPLSTLWTHSCARTAEGYRRLLLAHGFREVRVVRTGCPLDVVLATR